MSRLLRIALGIIAALALTATLVSFLPSDAWFVRVIDLVREPIVYAASLFFIASLFAKRWRWWLVGVFGLVIVLNLWRMWPYLHVAPAQIEHIAADDAQSLECFTALSINVKQENRDYGPVLAQIRQHDPDILLLMETDARWLEALRPVLAGYGAVEEYPLDNAYGMAFATRLQLLDSTFVENTSRNTPTFYSALAVSGGRDFEFIGLHPKPPLPGQGTEKRDENIARAGYSTPRKSADAIVMGDFNDVPWSDTTGQFRIRGNWRDPRVGRGTYPTFPASLVTVGWPLDQLMVKGDIQVKSFAILPKTSADHRAVKATYCLSPAGDEPAPESSVQAGGPEGRRQQP